jgi:hypothetical protein
LNNNIPINWTIPTSYKAMHETKSPHMNHIHQHKSHNTIDLDLQSLYSISIKGITMIVCSKLFSQSSKLTNKRRELTYLYTRGAHGLLKEGAPSVKEWAAKCGEEGCHLSHIHQQVSIKLKQRRGRHLLACGLPPQEGATSPRGAHLLIPHAQIKKISINQIQSHGYCPL